MKLLYGVRRQVSAVVAFGALCASAQAAVPAWMPDVYYTAGRLAFTTQFRSSLGQ